MGCGKLQATGNTYCLDGAETQLHPKVISPVPLMPQSISAGVLMTNSIPSQVTKRPSTDPISSRSLARQPMPAGLPTIVQQ